MSKRLDILRNSLEKKQACFDSKLSTHFSDVRSANGQPLNDKRNGHVTLNRWEKQNDSLRSLDAGIEVTKNAIEREENKIAFVEAVSEEIPQEILALVTDGTLIQWRKHPNYFFVAGVDKARIIWDLSRKVVAHKYISTIKDKDQWVKFRDVYNKLNAILN